MGDRGDEKEVAAERGRLGDFGGCNRDRSDCEGAYHGMSSEPTRVLLVDDHEVLRSGMRSLLEASEGYSVCGEAADGRAGVERASELRPDIVVMDIG